MSLQPTTFKPSTANTTGTAAGTLVGSLAVGYLTHAPFIASAALALGITPVGLAGIVGIGVTAIVNYGVTHYTELRELDNLAKLIPASEHAAIDFPSAPPLTKTPNNLSNG